MWETIIRIVPCLIAAGIIGGIIGWALSRLLGDKSGAAERENLHTKLHGLERDLDKARGEARTHRDQVNALKSDLASTADKLIARDKELVDLEVRIKSFDTLEGALAAKNAELSSLTAEFDALKTRLADAEAALKKPAQPDPNLLSELGALKQSLTGKDSEISALLARVKDLAPLSLQIKDRDLRLKDWDSKFAEAIKLKDAEIAALKARGVELESLHAQATSQIAQLESLQSQLSSRDARIGELETSLNDRDQEVARLRESSAESAEIDGLKAQLNDCAGKLRDAENRLQTDQSVENSQAVVNMLRARISDLEIMHQRSVTPPPEEEWDDLEAINGVGPVLAKMLNRLGIYTFKQVALWKDEQIEWVDGLLEHFKGRIVRENWIDSAKDEHFKKYGERL